MILQRKPDENSKWPWLLIKHLQRKRKWFLFYFKIRTNNKNHCKSTLHWGKHTFWIWRYICKGFGPQVVLQTPFQNKTPHPQPTCLFFTEMGRRLKTEFGSAAPCCWWMCWWKSRKQLQESKMGTCLIRHLDWELLLKEPSAWPTSCNFPNLLSYDCPTQPPSWLPWCSSNTPDSPLPALLYPQISGILQVFSQMPLLQEKKRWHVSPGYLAPSNNTSHNLLMSILPIAYSSLSSSLEEAPGEHRYLFCSLIHIPRVQNSAWHRTGAKKIFFEWMNEWTWQ